MERAPHTGRITATIYLALLLTCAVVTAAHIWWTSNTAHSVVEYGTSSLYSHEEIDLAAQAIFDDFHRSMRGCQLHRISYSVPDDGERDGIMFFTGSFRAPKNRPNSGFAPDEEVDYWEWHLERASNGEWVVLGKGVS